MRLNRLRGTSTARETDEKDPAAAEKTIAAYKAAADAITSEHAALQETAFASPRSKAARIESMRVREVEQHNAELLARVEELERVRAEEQAASETAERELVQRHAQEMARKIKEATSTAERELVELRQESKGCCAWSPGLLSLTQNRSLSRPGFRHSQSR